MRAVKILSVCGSGTVSSAMLSSKLTDVLEENGYHVEATEVSPGGVEGAMAAGKYDLIAYTSPVEGDYGVPILNATGFLVGINEDEFVEELLEAVGKLKL
ncbi:MAG: putative system, galactitol-specific component [Anaerocolumna sp.]|jgi:PTS system galactitol-specific IIB component|nr:putative system, galactitol-specific component [Herbinix sp.]MDF2952394.1 putative system, galactitol-specific component [Anaerocolumna sp.]